MTYLFFILLTISLIGGEILRWQFNNGISITLLDIIGILALFASMFHLVQGVQSSFIIKPFLYFLIVCFISLAINLFSFPLAQIGVGSLYLLRFIDLLSITLLLYSFSPVYDRVCKISTISAGMVITFLGFIQLVYYPSLRNLYYLGWDEHLHRLFSTFLDPNFAGIFFALFAIFLLTATLRFIADKKYYHMLLFLIFFLLSTLALFLTYSRSGYVVFLLSFLCTLLYQKKRLIIFLAITGLIIGSFVFLPHQLEGNNLLRTASTFARITTDKNALTIFEKNSFIGVGFNMYRYAQYKYGFLSGENWIATHAGSGPENSYLLVVATTGIIGSIAYIFLLVRIYVLLQPQKNKGERVPLFIGFLISGLFLNSLFYPFLFVWIVLLIKSTESK